MEEESVGRIVRLESDIKLLAWLHAEQTYLLARAAEQLLRLQVLIAQAISTRPDTQQQVQDRLLSALRG